MTKYFSTEFEGSKETWHEKKNFGQCKQRELDHNFHYKIFLFEQAHGTARNISNTNVIFTSPARGENLTDKDERFETYSEYF